MTNNDPASQVVPERPSHKAQGETVYVRSNEWGRAAMAVLQGKTLKKDRRIKYYGRIRANFFYYVTTPMILITIGVICLVVAGFETLLPYIMTNLYLNGLIISLLIFAILKSYYNCYLLYQAARFFKALERLMAQDVITPKDIAKIRKRLEKRAQLVNTIYMTESLDDLETFGHPNFNDTRARFIKSKLGQRVSVNKANVGFIAGMLVMLGLLGTFLGLLGTIDAVGEAMNSMANIGGDGGEIGMEEMTGFIGSLAAPLQGMGLAFSTSLFGLSGSLMIGFFLHLTGTPQNHFIENVSRWLDDRIVKFKPDLEKTKEAEKIKAKPTDNDLKEWMGGFVHMAVKTHRHLDLLTNTMGGVGQEVGKVTDKVDEMVQAQKAATDLAEHMDQNLVRIVATGSEIEHKMQAVLDNAAGMQEALNGVQASNTNISTSVRDALVHMQKMQAEASHIAGVVDNKLKDYEKYMNDNAQAMQQNIQVGASLAKSMQALEEAQGYIANTQHEGQEKNLVLLSNIQSTLEQLNQSQGSLINASKIEMDSRQEQTAFLQQAISSHLQTQSDLLKVSGEREDSGRKIGEVLTKAAEDMRAAQENWSSMNAADVKASKEMIQSMEAALEKMSHSQTQVNQEVQNLLQKLQSDPNVKQVESLVDQIKDMLVELNEKAKSAFNRTEN